MSTRSPARPRIRVRPRTPPSSWTRSSPPRTSRPDAMPNACNYTWSTALDTVIREESRSAGVPLDLAYTFVAVESGFDPLIRNLSAIEDSVGLLQLNRRGGQGQEIGRAS